jgi:hypothetical protein
MGWRVVHYRGPGRGAPVLARGHDEVAVLRDALQKLRRAA